MERRQNKKHINDILVSLFAFFIPFPTLFTKLMNLNNQIISLKLGNRLVKSNFKSKIQKNLQNQVTIRPYPKSNQ